jgi:hypothetical protein
MVSPNGLLIIYVGRPTFWGNRYRIPPFTRERAFELYEQNCSRDKKVRRGSKLWKAWKELVKSELKGKNLCCWCRLDQKCHADILLKIANEEEK